TEGVIIDWHKKVGEKVKSGDLLAEIETDKAVMEFESFQEGTLLYIGADKGQSVKVDDVIAVLGKEGEDYHSALQQNNGADKTTPLADLPPKKKSADGEINGQKKLLLTVASPTPQPSNEEKGENNPASSAIEAGRMKASPLARKIASDSGVELSDIKGSGDDGRIIKRDIEKVLTEGTSFNKNSIEMVEGEEGFEEIPLSLMRKTIARRLVESKFSAPHFYLTMHMNMDMMVEARNSINNSHPENKISFNDIIIKAVALALKRNRNVNASWHGESIRYNHHIHIGMAVAVEDGLLVPVIKFADQKSLSQISEEAKSLAAKAKEKKLQPEEMQGNTFTISNLGMMDIDEFTAIINPPDACIMAIGKVRKIPVVINDQVKVGNVLTVTLSCDHRLVDGATGARFLQTFKSYMENPLSMLY
ncbi:MAG: 2-oxo acid dehydrogenase subunit E2, partial [Chitinophagales bacterium]|nr:2-oxo acid dehydrogenase subunit E2 [Chitinophagales bacterium]